MLALVVIYACVTGIPVALDKGKTHISIVNIVTVLAIVNKADTVAALGKVGILVSANLKFSLIPGCIDVGGTLDCSKLDLVTVRQVGNRFRSA